MSRLRVLIVENEEEWRSLIRRQILDHLDAEVLEASTPEEADQKTRENAFDLITLDIRLVRDAGPLDETSTESRAFLTKLQENSLNRDAGLLLLSAIPHADLEHLVGILQITHSHSFLVKGHFGELFVARVNDVLRNAHLMRAERSLGRKAKRQRTAIYYLDDCWLGYRRTGQEWYEYFASRPSAWNSNDFSSRADQLGRIHLLEDASGAGDLWRSAAKSIGETLFSSLGLDPEIRKVLPSRLDRHYSDEMPSTLQFNGPPQGLRVPFELLRDEAGYLALTHIVLRQLTGLPAFREGSLVNLLRSLHRKGRALRVLIVGAPGSNNPAEYSNLLDGVEEEVEVVRRSCTVTLMRLYGIQSKVICLSGEDASPSRVKRALAEGCHIFHYSGHGHFESTIPELSGPVLWQGGKRCLISAPELYRWLLGSKDLHLAFLNCCLGARVASRRGYGDFHGALDAVVQANIPWALGHRWRVDDRDAVEFADFFYRALWQSFDPGQALLRARQLVSERSTGKRNNPMWASPVLVYQGH